MCSQFFNGIVWWPGLHYSKPWLKENGDSARPCHINVTTIANIYRPQYLMILVEVFLIMLGEVSTAHCLHMARQDLENLIQWLDTTPIKVS